MLKTIFTTILRQIRKNTFFSLINIFGFTLGIASFILMLLFVVSELSYDRYNEKSDRIYRLCIRALIGDTKINQTYSSAMMFRQMREKYPEIQTGVKFINWTDINVRIGEKNFTEPSLMFSDSTVFDVFTIPFKSGDPAKALCRPRTMVISETAARKYFGGENPIGKTIELDFGSYGKSSAEVTGIYEDIPSNAHFHFNMMVSMTSFPQLLEEKEWTANNFVTYFLLKPGASASQLEEKFKKYTIESIGEENYKAAVAKGSYWEFFLQPLTSIHLHSDLNGEFEPNGNVKYVYIFIVIAFFVLIIACINFMNLSTAKSTLRAKEVGIKKTAGSSKGKLIRQFLSESVIITFISLILAIIIVQTMLPAYSNWLGRELSLNLLSANWIIPSLLVFGCVIGIIAGLYPAFFLSSFSPTRVLKAASLAETKGIGLRNILVIVQFAASIFLIIGTLVISRQLNFIQNKDIGFVKENILIIRTPSAYTGVNRVFENEIKQHAGVIGVSASGSLPGFSFTNWGFGAEGVDKPFTLNIIPFDAGFEKTLGFRMVQGRFFSPDFPTDSSGIILNETAVRVLGLKNPLGTKMFDGQMPPNNYHVIGVVKDFNYESVHSEIRPMGLTNLKGQLGSFVSIRYEKGKEKDITSLAKTTWEKLLPGIPFTYSYMEDDYRNLYRNEIQTKQVFTMLAGLAVLVSILGLLGLASFMAQRRIKEIALRKVSGAGVAQIINLFTWKFVKWVIVSFVIACPVAWWVMNRWLQDFAFRVPLSAWIFILSGAIALVLVIITVSMITFRAATVNPAESIKYE